MLFISALVIWFFQNLEKEGAPNIYTGSVQL